MGRNLAVPSWKSYSYSAAAPSQYSLSRDPYRNSLIKDPALLANRPLLQSDRFITKPDPNQPAPISQFPAPEPYHVSNGQVNPAIEVSIRKVAPPQIASLQPATDHKNFPIDSNFYAAKAFKFPIAVTSAIKAVRDQRSPNAAAALAYMKVVNSQDICARSTQLYLETILQGGTVDQANAAATKIYIDDYNNGLSVVPGSACDASDIAWRKAEAEGKDPVVYSAIAFMEHWPGMKEGNPCAISGRDYVNAIVEGASHTQANLIATKSFADAIISLGAQGKELRDPACAAATKAYFNALPSKPSPPRAASMIAFLDKAFDGFSFQFDPVCWRAAETYFESYAAGNDELQSNRRAARVFLNEFDKGGSGIPADSPCAAARAYYKNIPNPPSPANKAAMEAFMDKMITDGKREPDPACSLSTIAYWDAYESGATETDANLAAAEGFFKAFREGLHIPAMIAQGNKRVYDPVCMESTLAFWDSYRSGDDELTANFKANLAFIEEYKKGAKVPANSPCLISTIAYSKAIKNLPSPPNNAAMLAFMEEAILSNMDRVDPVCLASSEAYYEAYLAGKGEVASNEIAGIAFLDAVAASPDFDPGSPCGVSAKAYMANIDTDIKVIFDGRTY